MQFKNKILSIWALTGLFVSVFNDSVSQTLVAQDQDLSSFISRDPISNQLSLIELTSRIDKQGSKQVFLKSNSVFESTDNDETSIIAAIYLNGFKKNLGLKNTSQSFSYSNELVSNFGSKHVAFKQQLNGIPVYGSEIKVHFNPDGKFKALSGHLNTFNSPIKTASISINKAIDIAVSDVKTKTKAYHLSSIQKAMLKYDGPSGELYFLPNNNQLTLSYRITYCPNFHETWEIFVSAEDGSIIYSKELTCYIDGPKTTNKGTSLDNENEKIGTYKKGEKYYLIDAGKPMFSDATSVIPQNPKGVIQTYNANNLTRDELENAFIPESDVNEFGKVFTERSCVSAQVNASNYYDKLAGSPFNYNSYDNDGSNITMYTNMSSPTNPFIGWDNASWNGRVALFGKGYNIYKSPLSKGLDIVAHELTHGLIEHSTNIRQGSGAENAALQEAICDIMAIIIDGNYTIGENSNVNDRYRLSGLVRNPIDPHNGLVDAGNWESNQINGYSANHVNEFANNERAAHFNSTILSHAFYLLAVEGNKHGEGIGINVAQELFFDVVTNYLTASADFIDFKDAMLLAVDIRFGAGSGYYNVIKEAFNTVGLTTNDQVLTIDDLPAIIGENYVLSNISSNNKSDVLSLYKMAELSEDERLNETSISLKANASVTDNGEMIYTVDQSSEIVRIKYGDKIKISRLTDSLGIGYKSVAVSKYNERLALVKLELDTSIHIYDIEKGTFKKFPIRLKTKVQHQNEFYDLIPIEVGSMEWDYFGTKVIFDYKNRFVDKNGEVHFLWNIAEINVWDSSRSNFASGNAHAFYSQISSDIDIRYPSFAKNTTSLFVHDIYDNKRKQNTVMAWSINSSGIKSTEILKTKTYAHASYTNTD
ncbi:MAG: M4 family metallopeptidase, partial [Bacteroidia bacterium]